MTNFGFKHLRLVNPYDVAYREARSAVHAQDILRSAQEFETLADLLEYWRERVRREQRLRAEV